MKKLIVLLVCIIVLGVLGFGAYYLWQNRGSTTIIDENKSSGDDIIEQDQGLAASTIVKGIEIRERSLSDHRNIDILYPSIQSFKNQTFQNGINSEITSVIQDYRSEISTVIDSETPSGDVYTYIVSYEKYTYGDYLSLIVSNKYNTGGIRSNEWKDTYNIDVRKERKMVLADLFAPNVDYKKEILGEIKAQAQKNNYELMNGKGLSNLSEKQKFYIKDSKLVIYFDPAEIAPATYGALQFEMPFTLGEDGLFTP